MLSQRCRFSSSNGLYSLYGPTEWRLFIYSSKASLKCVLLHNGNRYASIPIDHFVHLKETYENMNMLLMKIKYNEHKWMV